MDHLIFSSNNRAEKDTIDSYFECISECNVINGHQECVTRCVEKYLKGENKNE